MPEFPKRISIRGKKFNDTEDSITCIIVNAAKISRAYYTDTYESGKVVRPTCWSSDTQVPSKDVPDEQRQAARCMDCIHNIRGSGYGSSRACRFLQRLAVVLENELDTVYQLRLPAASIFGQPRDGNMPMQAYARFLEGRGTSAVAIVTQIYFDTNSYTPKLFFKPSRPLEEEEYKMVSKMIDHPDTIKAITLEFSSLFFEGTRTSPFESTDGFQFKQQEINTYG